MYCYFISFEKHDSCTWGGLFAAAPAAPASRPGQGRRLPGLGKASSGPGDTFGGDHDPPFLSEPFRAPRAPSCVLFLLPTVFLLARRFLRRLSLPSAVWGRGRGEPRATAGNRSHPRTDRTNQPQQTEKAPKTAFISVISTGTKSVCCAGEKFKRSRRRWRQSGLRARWCSCSPAALSPRRFPQRLRERGTQPAPRARLRQRVLSPSPKGEKPRAGSCEVGQASSLVLKYLKKSIYCRVSHRSTKSAPSEQPVRRRARPSPEAERGSACPGQCGRTGSLPSGQRRRALWQCDNNQNSCPFSFHFSFPWSEAPRPAGGGGRRWARSRAPRPQRGRRSLRGSRGRWGGEASAGSLGEAGKGLPGVQSNRKEDLCSSFICPLALWCLYRNGVGLQQ